MKNIKGSVTYWKRVFSKLIILARTLYALTWFLTFSSNDLNWLDIQEALLITNKHDANEAVRFADQIKLVQQYPVAIARQFIVRMNDLIHYLKNNPDLLGSTTNIIGKKFNSKIQ